jgi:TolA-binding protein
MTQRSVIFDLNSTQDFYAEGRIKYACQLHDEGVAAMQAKDLAIAIKKLRTSARAYPIPSTLRLIGECLLRQGKPADATLYLAAAAGMTSNKSDKRSLLLLIRALLRARENVVARIRLQEIAETYPDMAEAISNNPEQAVEELLRRLVK